MIIIHEKLTFNLNGIWKWRIGNVFHMEMDREMYNCQASESTNMNRPKEI